MTFLDLRTPSFRMLCILALGVLSVFATATLAIRQVHLGHSFPIGSLLKGTGDSLEIEALDLTGEPGEISDDQELERFYTRQDRLTGLLLSPDLQVQEQGQTLTLSPQSLSMSDLPSLFWIQIAVGLGAFLISAWVWALRSKDLAARLFFLSGVATLFFTFASAIYTTRELALPALLFRSLVALNVFGASLFGISTLALFSVYPHRLSRWRSLIAVQATVFGIWTGCSLANLLPAWAGVNLITLTEMIGICLAIGAQFWSTKGDPKARASLTWLGLSVLVGAGIFIAFNAMPLVLGQEVAIEQGYAFLSFLLIYIGLSAGISRYRLFEVGQWAYRFLFYALGAALLLALDGVLIFVMGVDRFPALGVSFVMISLLYLPLRESIRIRLVPRSRLKAHELMEEVLQVAFAPSLARRVDRWQALLRKVFDPLELAPLVPAVDQVQMHADGLSLFLPQIGNVPSLKISYQSSGRSLFSPDSCKLASQLVALIEQAESGREAYDRGVLEERRRMAQDLHDDVGARLLTAIYTAEEKTRPALNAVLADIKEIVSEMTDERISLEQVLADLRYETTRRLSLTAIALDWPLPTNDKEFEHILGYREHKALRSAFRELISNVIRHAAASQVRVRMDFKEGNLHLLIADNGKGLPQTVLAGESQGYGLKSMSQRLLAMGGRLHMESSEGGSTIILEIPCGKSC